MDLDRLAQRFEMRRAQLRTVAYHMLGSASEAEDAVQETWIRLSRADAGQVENLAAWLTTVIGRVCLDMLRTRRSRREEPLSTQLPEPRSGDPAATDPERVAILADVVGMALLVVLERLSPTERLVFVLHDMFSVPFDQIATIVNRSPDAARQLASRARRRVRDAEVLPDPDRTRQHKVADAFLAAAGGGDFDALVALLAPDVVIRADRSSARSRAPRQIRGAHAAATEALGYARLVPFALPAVVNGRVGAVVAPRGRLFSVMAFTIQDGTIAAIDFYVDPERHHAIEVAIGAG